MGGELYWMGGEVVVRGKFSLVRREVVVGRLGWWRAAVVG